MSGRIAKETGGGTMLGKASLRTNERERGSMLIVALGVLTLLTVLAITFVALMKLELQASKNYVDGVKARMVAEGGLEQSLAQLKFYGGIEAASQPNSQWVYAGGHYELALEDAKIPGSFDAAGKVIVPPDPDYQKDDIGLPGQPNYKPSNRVSFWGVLARSYAQGFDRYKVAVIDAATQFNLNNTLDDDAYIRELSCLGYAIAKIQNKPNPILGASYPRGTVTPATLFGAQAILAFRNSREGKSFKTKSELQEILATDQDWITLRNYVTTKSWADPQAVVAASLDGFNAKLAPWSDAIRPTVEATSGGRPLQRSPINVNLASREVIAANIAGIAGRGLYLHLGDYNQRNDPNAGILQKIDATTKYEFAGTTVAQVREELKYGPETFLIYIDPFGYALPISGDLQKDPPRMDGALMIADLIAERRATVGPFKSFAEWDRFVDQVVTDDLLNSPTGTNYFPQPGNAHIYHLDATLPKCDPALETEIKSSVRFKSFYLDCVRSLLKANANPNPRISSFNPNSPVYLEIDKGNLWYPQYMTGKPSATPPVPAFPDSKLVVSTQTCEWCFSPKGVFEITALGEVLGPDSKVPYAQAKIQTVIQLYDNLQHTSQMDFESKGFTYKNDSDRLGMLSQPITKLFWDPNVGVDDITGAAVPQTTRDKFLESGGDPQGRHAHDLYGYLELSPRIMRMDPLNPPSDSHVFSTGFFGQERFAWLMDTRRAVPGVKATFESNFIAQIANGQIQQQDSNKPLGSPTNEPALSPYAVPQLENNMFNLTAYRGLPARSGLLADQWKYEMIFADGYYANELRNMVAWWRASDRETATLPAEPWDRTRGYGQGNSALRGNAGGGTPNPGNVYPTGKGAVELWYKPEFDWFVHQKQPGSKFQDPKSVLAMDPNTNAPMADDRFCGLLSTSHITENPDVLAPDPGSGGAAAAPTTKKTRGTQMFLCRTTSGDLRATRLYFEVVGPGGPGPNTSSQEFPLVRDIKAVTAPGAAHASPPAAAPLITLSEYMNRATTDPAYTWPPLEFQNAMQAEGYKDIKAARVDAWIPAKFFADQDWRAHEWHHIAVYWDDTQADENKVFVFFIDGQRMATAPGRDVLANSSGKAPYQATINPGGPNVPVPPQPPLPQEPATPFVRLNNKANPQAKYPLPRDQQFNMYPKDLLTIGGIWREQAPNIAGGIFKFTPRIVISAQGTVDDVRFYDASTVNIDDPSKAAGAPPNRYEDGYWTGEIDFSDRFGVDNTLQLGQLGFTAYLPTHWGKTVNPNGGGKVTLTVSVLTPDGQVKKNDKGEDYTFVKEFSQIGPVGTGVPNPDPISDVTVSQRPLVTASGDVAKVTRYPTGTGSGTGWIYDRVKYRVDMEPFRDASGYKVATPALDDVTITYYLPTPLVLLKEKVND